MMICVRIDFLQMVAGVIDVSLVDLNIVLNR
jgi:hypothetical protein